MSDPQRAHRRRADPIVDFCECCTHWRKGACDTLYQPVGEGCQVLANEARNDAEGRSAPHNPFPRQVVRRFAAQ